MDISNNEIMELVRRTLTPEQIERSLVYWYKKVFQKGEPIQVGPQAITMPFEGTIVFVDLAPRANWAHPCLYVLVDKEALTAKVIKASLPPNIDQSDESYVVILRFGQIPPHERYFNIFDK